MKAPTLTRRTIRSLRDPLLHDHKFAIPKLQRNFVWDAGRAAKLLDSIYHQMPIGSLFLWEMDRTSANLIRQASGVLPSFNDKNKLVWFVIDGQQRLSVIYQAFKGEMQENDAGRPIDFSRLCFVVNPDPEKEDPDRIVYRKPIDKEFVPLHHILATDWKRKMPSQAKGFLNKIAKCRELILSYPLPLVTVGSATLDEIGKVFIRVNSQGMRITTVDRAIALMGALDVRAMAQQLRQKVREKVFALNGIDSILMGFNLVSEKPQLDSDPPKLEAMARRWSRHIQQDGNELARFKKDWHRYQSAFLAAVDYLHKRLPVHDESYLPSANMLATLAVFFFYHPARPGTLQRKEICKWFWATGLAKRYSGAGYHSNIVADARFFESLATGGRKEFILKPKDRLDPVLDLQAEQYQAGSARTRTFFCLLASQEPRDLESGQPIDLSGDAISPANHRHRHHLFPRAQLREHVSAKAYNSLCNICFLISCDNLAISSRLPRSYLGEYAQKGRTQFKGVMRSHLVPVGPDSGVWETGIVRGFKKFREERLALIRAAFEKEAGMTLFRKD